MKRRSGLLVARMVGLAVDRFLVISVSPLLSWEVFLYRQAEVPLPLMLKMFITLTLGIPVLAAVVWLAIYVTVTCSIWGGTPGMLFVGLRLTRADGSKVGFLRVLWRHALSYVSTLLFCAGYVWALIDKKGRAWHDIASGTVVVYRREVQ